VVGRGIPSPTRRDVLQASVAATFSGPADAARSIGDLLESENRGEFEGDVDDYENEYTELFETVWGNARFPWKAWDVASGYTDYDVNYWWDNMRRAMEVALSGDLDRFQSFSPSVVSLSNRGGRAVLRHDDLGRVSGFMDNGREQVPFEPTPSVNRDEGVFAGVELDGDLQWLPYESTVRGERTGLDEVTFTYDLDGLEVVQRSRMLDGEGIAELDFRVTNDSPGPIDGDFLIYGRAAANDTPQTPFVFKPEPNRVSAGDNLEWHSLASERSFVIETGREVVESGVFSPHVEDRFSRFRERDSIRSHLFGPLIARMSADQSLAVDYEGTEFENFREGAKDSVTARYGSGFLSTPMVLQPGESEEYTVWINGQPDGGSYRETEWNGGVTELLKANVEMHLLEDGGVQAAHNIQPMYYPVWIRDAVFTLDALKDVDGVADYAWNFFADFLPDVQRDNGSFNQCFNPDRSETGTWYSELDQPAIYATKFPAFDRYFDGKLFGNDEARVTYAAALARMLENLSQGQVYSSPDYSEQPFAFFRQSLWKQAYFYEAFTRVSENYDLSLDLSTLEEYPDVLERHAEHGVFSIDDGELQGEAEKILERTEETYFEDEGITNEGLLFDSNYRGPLYSKLLEDTDLFEAMGRDGEFFESIAVEEEGYWSPALAVHGKVLDQYGMENDHVKERIRDSITDLGKLPERPDENGWNDAMELAWGSAEAYDLFENH